MSIECRCIMLDIFTDVNTVTNYQASNQLQIGHNSNQSTMQCLKNEGVYFHPRLTKPRFCF